MSPKETERTINLVLEIEAVLDMWEEPRRVLALSEKYDCVMPASFLAEFGDADELPDGVYGAWDALRAPTGMDLSERPGAARL
jgi:hypothetical protein